MFKPFAIAALALTLLIGTVGAAAASQPGDALYSFRIWSEQVQTRGQVRLEQPPAQPTNGIQLQQQEQIRLQTQTCLPTAFTPVPPQNTGGGNPWATGTPTPYNSYGPGPGDCTCTTCTSQPYNQARNGAGNANRP